MIPQPLKEILSSYCNVNVMDMEGLARKSDNTFLYQLGKAILTRSIQFEEFNDLTMFGLETEEELYIELIEIWESATGEAWDDKKGKVIVEDLEYIKYNQLNSHLNRIFQLLETEIKPGITTKSLEKIVSIYLKNNKIESLLKGYENYQYHLITSINNEIHNIPPSKKNINSGDFLTLSIGLRDSDIKVFQTWTYAIGNIDEVDLKLLNEGVFALEGACNKGITEEISMNLSLNMVEYYRSKGFYTNTDSLGHIIFKNLNNLILPLSEVNNEKCNRQLNRNQVYNVYSIISNIESSIETDKSVKQNKIKDNPKRAIFSKMILIREKPFSLIQSRTKRLNLDEIKNKKLDIQTIIDLIKLQPNKYILPMKYFIEDVLKCGSTKNVNKIFSVEYKKDYKFPKTAKQKNLLGIGDLDFPITDSRNFLHICLIELGKLARKDQNLFLWLFEALKFNYGAENMCAWRVLYSNGDIDENLLKEGIENLWISILNVKNEERLYVLSEIIENTQYDISFIWQTFLTWINNSHLVKKLPDVNDYVLPIESNHIYKWSEQITSEEIKLLRKYSKSKNLHLSLLSFAILYYAKKMNDNDAPILEKLFHENHDSHIRPSKLILKILGYSKINISTDFFNFINNPSKSLLYDYARYLGFLCDVYNSKKIVFSWPPKQLLTDKTISFPFSFGKWENGFNYKDVDYIPYRLIISHRFSSSWVNNEDQIGVLWIENDKINDYPIVKSFADTENQASGVGREILSSYLVSNDSKSIGILLAVKTPYSRNGKWGNDNYLYFFDIEKRKWFNVFFKDFNKVSMFDKLKQPVLYEIVFNNSERVTDNPNFSICDGELLMYEFPGTSHIYLDKDLTSYHLDNWEKTVYGLGVLTGWEKISTIEYQADNKNDLRTITISKSSIAKIYLSNGIVKASWKDVEGAIKDFEKALEIDPDNQDVKDELTKLKSTDK